MNYNFLFLCSISFIFGLIVGKLRKYEFTDNTKIIIKVLKNELGFINNELKKSNTINRRCELIKRSNEIRKTLLLFYGK